MESHVPRKRKQSLSLTRRLEKCPRVGENNPQEIFCVDSDCEVDDGDCVVVAEKITIRRGRCQNAACLSPEGTKLQKASRRVQDFYGHSYRKGRAWKICDICHSRAEEHLGKLKNKFINRVPVVGGQYPFYGEMVALEEEDSTDEDDEEPLDDTVAEFMSNCASDMINTIFEKYDINFQLEEGVKKLLEGYEKVESEIEAQIKSCEEVTSSFRTYCDEFYKEHESSREELTPVEIDCELPPVEIDCGPAEVIIDDDNSDGDDVIVVESVRSLQNLPEALNENTSSTNSQPHAVCPNEQSVTEQTPVAQTSQPYLSPAAATNHRVFGELRTIVKFSGGNSGCSSTKTDVVNGCILDKRNSEVQRVQVRATGTGEMVRGSYTKASGKESSAQKHQTSSEGVVIESAPVQSVPLQQLLQQGLSVLGAQPGATNKQEKAQHKQQQPPSQIPREHTNQQISALLQTRLQQRFSVLNPSTETTCAQEKQHEAHRLHGHTAPTSPHKQGVENVPSMQQQASKIRILQNTVHQQNRQQTSQTHQQSSGHLVSQPSQRLSEQRIQLVPSQSTVCTQPQPNMQLSSRILQECGPQFPQRTNDQSIVQTMNSHTEPNVSKELSHHSSQSVCRPQQLSTEQSAQQNSTQFMSLQQSGQHVVSGAQSSSAQNIYHTPKQSIQQTASQLARPLSEKPVIQLPQPGRQSLASAQQQPSGHVSQPVQHPGAQYIPQSLQQTNVKSMTHQPQSVVQPQLQSDSRYKSLLQQQSSGQLVYKPSQQPGGQKVTQALQQPDSKYISQPSTGNPMCGARTTQKPNVVNTASTLQVPNETPSLKAPPVVQNITREQTITQHTPRMANATVHQNVQKSLHFVSGQVPPQPKVFPDRDTGSGLKNCSEKPNEFVTSETQNAGALSTTHDGRSSALKEQKTCIPKTQVALKQASEQRESHIVCQNNQQHMTRTHLQPDTQCVGQPQQCQTPQHPAVQASLQVPHMSSATCVLRGPQGAAQQNLQLAPHQHTAQKLFQSTNHSSVQSESQKPTQSSVKHASLSPQLTNHIVQHSVENNATQRTLQPTVQNMTNHCVQQSGHLSLQTLQNSSVKCLSSSSQPSTPSLSVTTQQGIRQTVQTVSQPQVTRSSILTEPQNVAVRQEKNNEGTSLKTQQQLNGLDNMLSTCQNNGQHTAKVSQVSKTQWGAQSPQKQNVPQISQHSGEKTVSQIPNQHSGKSVIQISGLCNQQRSTSQSESNLSKFQQQQKQQVVSRVVPTGEVTNRRQTESSLQRPSESIVPRNPLIFLKTVQSLNTESAPPKSQIPIVSELGLKQQQQQQKHYTPSSNSQEAQQLTPLTESGSVSHQAISRTQAQGPKNHLQQPEERTQLSLSDGDFLQNMSQPLQHLKNKQSEKTELKVQPVIPLQKSETSNKEGSLHHSNQQLSSSVPVSQVVSERPNSLTTNNQLIPTNVSQQSVVSLFPGNLFIMLQQQQVTMLLGFVCHILSRFLPIVVQQQCQKESTQAEVGSSIMNTDSSQEKNSKTTANPSNVRLPDKDGNEISDTESMCQSPLDSLTPFSTPTKSSMCTSPSTLSSTDSDISVSDSIGVCAEKDVVPVGNVIIKESNLPPLGLVNRPPVAVGDSMYIMNDIKRPWILATVKDIVSPNNQTLYTVEFLNSKNKNTKEIKKVAGFQLAYSQVQNFRFSVGHRIISIFRDGISDEEYYSGVIAEPPKSINRYRYLIFFDNGGSQYVKHEDIRLVVESSQNVWEDVHIEIREFVQNYLEKYPEKALLKVQEGQDVRTEWNRRWYNAKVLEVDASLAQMSFPPYGKHVEWIYRGSARFYPLFEAHNRTCKEQFARSKAFARKRGDPYIQYTLKEEEELDKEIKDDCEAVTEDFEPTHRSTARKSTSQITPQYPRLSSSVKAPKRIFYPCYSQVTYSTHKCKPSCLVIGSSEKDFSSYRNLLSHLSEPMLHGWTREKVKHSDYVSVYYRAPCKRRLRNIEELHKYLLLTKSKLTVDQFDFDHWVRCFTEGINEKYFIKIEDISHGVEAVPVPCINTVDSRKPDDITYVTKHVPTNGTYIETDPEFLVCCECTDDCLDKEKCACWQQTMEGVKYGPESESPNHEGYYYKRLYEPLVTGIYECNSRCKCSSTCLNRLVQLPMKCKIQVFMTPNRGWGIRALHDIPKGNFICLYAGHVLPEKVGDALAKQVGDEYQADLDYIESAEKVKEDYEENAYESELEEDCGKRQNSKHRGQTTVSRKPTGKQHKIMAPSTRILFGRNGRYILDAKTCGNVGRFINHSCNANLFAQNVFVDTHDLRFPWVAFFTNSFVPANTELTWNYGYDVDSVPERVIICKCGETNCQGRLL
ncbi:uncharacterized protein LOC126284229 isoform X1 [Schistocerca gregaria]|uniref:uncharacterized protein LOC126284229 isoform X1 n=1 Tax=Schistocerca gregaria TaxID=7010 RepID=UPI00211E8A5D|nr:uncharacterized protein LOC126284229 isoform X1 [Schistocerca gregaria]